ncbi:MULTISPECIES: beta-galactosidase [unclassified Actinomyces]|uniref:beta-galactosidase n=1 Tax=unclassified Actinomyces TaxID=2609248 RepID=UPI000D59AC11|nr:MULTISPECIES: beta-galactosidase [unclassified Actinomyces]RAX24014.1 beta-galactosidase [Actinomyces sp. Z3]
MSTCHQPFDPGHLLYGGDWNPDQWPREVWREDVALMRKAHVNTVTVCPFSWASMEPREGHYEFGWLDDAIELLADAGIGFFLATPTASPPPWFTLAHPDALAVTPSGVQLRHGSRDTYAIAAPAYRKACRRISRLLAERYGKHPALRGWHVHNEYGTIDYGPHAERGFRHWLKDKYGDLDNLNDAWGTSFWSQRYGSWEEILPPVATQYLPNPGLVLDFRRYSSDEMRNAYLEQAEQIRAAGSTVPITTNFMLPDWNNLEQWSWAEDLDVISLDHYLDSTSHEAEAHVAYGSDLARSWSGGPWILMEQNATQIKLRGRALPKPPERTIRDSLGYIARGSQSCMFFQWRASTAGAEQWHSGMLPHAGVDSEGFRTVVQLGQILKRLDEVHLPPVDGPIVHADVAIVWHADGWWALQTPDLPSADIIYAKELRATHRALRRLGIATDFVAPGASLDSYRLLVVPCLYPMDEQTAAWISAFARTGGTVVVTYLSGLADSNMRVLPGGYPGRLRDLLGAYSEALCPLEPGVRHRLLSARGKPLDAVAWTEHVHLTHARSVYSYAEGPLAGLPAITWARAGAGSAWYVSAQLTRPSLQDLWCLILHDADVKPTVVGAAPLGIEAVVRRSRDADYLFLMHDGEIDVDVTAPGVDLMSGIDLSEGGLLRAGSCTVIRLQPNAAHAVSVAIHKPADDSTHLESDLNREYQ